MNDKTPEKSGISLLFDNADFYAIAETQTPTSILKQPKANLTTNPLINKVNEVDTTPIVEKTNIEVFNEFIKSFVLTNYETMNDIIDKPDNISLFQHINTSINKKNRKLYLGLLLILITLLFFS